MNKNIRSFDGHEYTISVLVHETGLAVLFKGESLKIPTRVYFDEPAFAIENDLTDLQQTILNCIYLRHHNGFVRQKRLEKLIDRTEDLIVPFTFQLLGEYVIEILNILDKHINEATIEQYVTYIKENPKYWQQTQSRVSSYWDAYYRQKFPKFKDYIGKKIVDRLERKAKHCNG